MADLRKLLRGRRELLKIRVKSPSLGDITADLYDELVFDDDKDDLIEHVSTQSGLMAWWTVVYRTLEKDMARLEREYDVWWSSACEQVNQELWESMGQKSRKPSVSSVENTTKAKHKSEYMIWHRKLEDMRFKVALLKDIIRFWDEKGRMLVQASKFIKTEYDAHGNY